jgi:hypothetical protein
VAKGKPRLWVKMYENGSIVVWRDLGYGDIRLKTPEGVAEGKETVSVKGTLVVCRDQKIELYMKDALEISPEEDTLELDLEAEFDFPEVEDAPEEGQGTHAAQGPSPIPSRGSRPPGG